MLRRYRNSKQVYEVHLSPALKRSSAIWHFEQSNVSKIRDGRIFNFYTGLPHVSSPTVWSFTHTACLLIYMYTNTIWDRTGILPTSTPTPSMFSYKWTAWSIWYTYVKDYQFTRAIVLPTQVTLYVAPFKGGSLCRLNPSIPQSTVSMHAVTLDHFIKLTEAPKTDSYLIIIRFITIKLQFSNLLN